MSKRQMFSILSTNAPLVEVIGDEAGKRVLIGSGMRRGWERGEHHQSECERQQAMT